MKGGPIHGPSKTGRGRVPLRLHRLGARAPSLRQTTYTVLKKLAEKGVLRNENAVVTAAVPKEEILREESRAVVDRTFEGSLPSFLAHFMGGKTISDAEADELKAIIDRFREGDHHG